MPNPFRMMRDEPAKAVAIFAVAAIVGFGTCGLSALQLTGRDRPVLTFIAVAGAIVCFISVLCIIAVAVTAIIKALMGVFEK